MADELLRRASDVDRTLGWMHEQDEVDMKGALIVGKSGQLDELRRRSEDIEKVLSEQKKAGAVVVGNAYSISLRPGSISILLDMAASNELTVERPKSALVNPESSPDCPTGLAWEHSPDIARVNLRHADSVIVATNALATYLLHLAKVHEQDARMTVASEAM